MFKKCFATKKSLVIVLTTLFICLSHSLFYDKYTVMKVEIDGVSTENVELEYQNEKANIIREISGVNSHKHAKFNIYGRKLKYFKLKGPKNSKITKIQISGLKRYKIEPTVDNVYKEKTYTILPHIDLNLFITLSLVFLLLSIQLIYNPKELIKENENKIRNVEALRIIFTLGVVYCHFAEKINLISTGGRGVDFFFVLSGFFFALKFNENKTPFNFAMTKLINFLPLIFFGAFLHDPLHSVNSIFFLFEKTSFKFCDLINAPAWYLSVMFWSLLFYFYLFKIISSKTVRDFIVGIIVFVSLSIFSKCNSEFFLNIIDPSMIKGLCETGFGILLLNFIKANKSVSFIDRNLVVEKKINKLLSIFELLVLAFAIVWTFTPCFAKYDAVVLNILIYSTLIYLFVLNQGYISHFFEKNIFSNLSRYCLAIYLTHWFITSNVLKAFLRDYPVFTEHYKFVFIIVVFFISFILGIITHNLIEINCSKLLKRKILNS